MKNVKILVDSSNEKCVKSRNKNKETPKMQDCSEPTIQKTVLFHAFARAGSDAEVPMNAAHALYHILTFCLGALQNIVIVTQAIR
jgi:hypothetical protein